MTARFYTEQRLNRDIENHDFQTGSLRYPLDLEHLGSLPHALGATLLPPQGAFSSENDVTSLSEAGSDAIICTEMPCPKRMYNPFRNPTGHGDLRPLSAPPRNRTGHDAFGNFASGPEPLVKPVHVAAAAVALYLLFLPMRVL